MCSPFSCSIVFLSSFHIIPVHYYPEYYLLKINQFDDIARNTIDEWIYFFKNETIRDDFTAIDIIIKSPGLSREEIEKL